VASTGLSWFAAEVAAAVLASQLCFAPRVSALLILAAPLGCGDPIRPSDLEGIYVLERIGSDALPAVLQSDQYLRVYIVADTLLLNEDGSGRRTGLLEYEGLQGGEVTSGEVPVASEFTFQIVRGRIEIAFACEDTRSCVAPPHFIARLKDGGLQVFYAVGGRVPLIYGSAGDVD
jgi:hypothetical protein